MTGGSGSPASQWSSGRSCAFAASRTDGGIFGFTETGLNPGPQGILTVASEIVALVLLAATFVPRIGAGHDVRIPVALPLVGAAVVGTVVMSALWNQSSDAPADAAETPTSVSAGDGGAPAGDTDAAAVGAVEINGFRFTPAELTVAVGDTVTWTNAEGVDHSVVGDDDAFESERMTKEDTFEFTFDSAGTFAYICGLHPSMAGTITVE